MSSSLTDLQVEADVSVIYSELHVVDAIDTPDTEDRKGKYLISGAKMSSLGRSVAINNNSAFLSLNRGPFTRFL